MADDIVGAVKLVAINPKQTNVDSPVRISKLNEDICHRLCSAGQLLQQHRSIIILAAFIFWTAILAAMGYFRDFGQSETGFVIFGFLWMTVPLSFATYFIPRLLLHVASLTSGHKPEESDQG